MLVLLDRDGVLNQDRADFVKTPDELVMIPGAAEAVARINAMGWPVVVCTNQSCIGRGIINEERLTLIHTHLRDHLARAGAHLDDILFAPDPPWAETERRKPGAGMLREAMAKYRASPEDTVFIGDDIRDLQAAAKAGCRRILVRTGKGAAAQAKGLPAEVLPVTVAETLNDAVDRLLAASQSPTSSTEA
ncbi:HAD-IIIA family hydrolase [uncultured Ferrovibrio sp.]|jgi:D-glycero-D-manno-heptose 1,7-bisphosphate phosphatase|uniref:D-glycero-alpha-D-manno-heptose-1,7-bisphosphate 7-phosphatase n=1 Tax=uncultured Ferrovibrio sp. TaxID=1576913 RepID=UPI002609228F|nr:HAD-IIIA family hydrolase [uncultured Ferrovibrio sp.]